MFRRPTAPIAPDPPRRAIGLAELEAAGWAVPRSTSATPVGTLSSTATMLVDPSGLVVRGGWSVDWWVGADDRWHLASREPAIRQHLIDQTPVVETRLRVPGGDAVHRAFGIRSPRDEGDEWVVSEIENATAVPFAIALVIRPFVVGGLGDVREITVEPTSGGRGRDGARLVRVDGTPALVVSRAPGRYATGSFADGDAVDRIVSGAATETFDGVTCADGLATLAMVFPLPHTAQLRAVIPVGPGSEPGAAVSYPPVVPDAVTVAAGWDVHRRTPRVVVPDQRTQEAFDRARCQVLLAPDVAAAPSTLAALDLLDRPADVDAVVGRWPDRREEPTVDLDVTLLAVASQHWLVHRSDAMRDWLLPDTSAAVERLDRARRRGKLDDPAAGAAAADALRLTARMLGSSGQPDAAAAVGGLADRVVASRPEPTGVASATEGQPAAGFAADAATVLDVLGGLYRSPADGELELIPTFPPGWYGGSIEVHEAPTAAGRLSFATRWHGARPALLWDLEPHDDRAVTITVPGLDPTWSTTERRGDALLAEVAAPEGYELVREVAEHPDIDPAMRRPGRAPDAIADLSTEGGSFS